MRYARLGPSSVLVRVLITELGLPWPGFTTLLRVQRFATHFRKQQQATGGNRQRAITKSLRPHRGSKPASKQLQTTGEQGRITTNKFRTISSRLACSMAVVVSKSWPFWGCIHDDRPEHLGRSLVCGVGIYNEGRCSSIAIGPSKECKRVGNKACAMPWCHGVGDFKVKTSRF